MEIRSNIRRSLALECMSNPMLTKAIAFSLKVKMAMTSSRIDNFSINKLKKVTGCHPTTIKKRLDVLESIGMVRHEGSSVIFCPISSKHKERNIFIKLNGTPSVKDIEHYLQSAFLVIIQSRKDYIAHTLLTAQGKGDGAKKISNIKSARRKCRVLRIRESFRDYGIPYKTIGKKLNVCAKTAYNRVKYACENGYIGKKRHFIVREMEDAELFFYNSYNGFMYAYGNRVFRVCPNTYSITNKGYNILGGKGAAVGW